MEEIAVAEITRHDFPLAKINTELLGTNTEYVLCLYYRDDSRRVELKRRADAEYPDAKYRWWKVDEDTRAGKHSPEFLENLDPEDRERFTQGRV